MVLTAVVRESCRVTGGEVEGAGFRGANENCRATMSLMEVDPFLGLLSAN